jgi:response regulator NasT
VRGLGGGMLMVCSQKSVADKLLKIISTVLPGIHATAVSGSQARRLTSLTDYSLILIAGKLKDESAENLALELADSGIKPIVILVDAAELSDAREILVGLGVTILTKPLSKQVLLNTIGLVSKLSSGEGGIFEKAKLRLVQEKGWSEPQAHRYIQKVSMERRLPRDVTAQYVLKALDKEKSKQ